MAIDVETIKKFLESKALKEGAFAFLNITENVENSSQYLALVGLAQRVEQKTRDGFQWNDLPDILSEAVSTFMSLAKDSNVSGGNKKKFVVALVKALYTLIDKGLDGTHNRINIPLVPDKWERKIEMTLLEAATSYAIEAVYRSSKEPTSA